MAQIIDSSYRVICRQNAVRAIPKSGDVSAGNGSWREEKKSFDALWPQFEINGRINRRASTPVEVVTVHGPKHWTGQVFRVWWARSSATARTSMRSSHLRRGTARVRKGSHSSGGACAPCPRPRPQTTSVRPIAGCRRSQAIGPEMGARQAKGAVGAWERL